MNKRLLLAVLVSFSFMLPVNAADVPDYYPKIFMVFGILHDINTSEASVTIDDFRLHMTSGVRVYTPTTQYGTVRQLKKGMQVGARPDRQGVIREIWVLPDGYLKLPQSRS